MASRKTTTRPAPDLTTAGTTRVALYLRISTDEEHQPFSLSAQEHRLAAFVSSQPGWEHVKTYTDQFSGAYLERPALQQALLDARLGLYDTLLVYRVDRFARSLKVLVGLLEELETIGVAFRSATEPIDTSTPTGRMLIQLLGVFAEFERATIIDRVVAGMERKAARGGWPGGSIPYGLQLDEDHHLAVRESEFPIVKRIFTRYGIDKAGAVTIATELNDDGLRTRTGRRWSAKVVLGIIRNRGYLGEISFRDVVHQAEEPLLDPVLFDKAQALLDERGECYDRRFANTHPEYLLTGLITCSRCHRNYVGVSAHGKRHRYRYYACWTTQRYGKDACSAERLRADALEEAVLAALVDLYGDPEFITRALAANQQTSIQSARQQQDEIAATEMELAKTDAAVERYMHAFEAGTLTADIFADRVRDLGDKAKALRVRRAELGQSAAQATAPLPTIAEVETLRDQLQEIALRGPGHVRKAVAQAFVHSLTVESRDCILPRFEVRRGLTISNTGED
ncbi:MAG: recombinase family protein, partial [Acidimicrobiales bacterium]